MSKLTRIEFTRQIAAFATEQRRLIETEVDGFEIDAEAMQRRIARARGDYEFFARTYFPHYVKSQGSLFHRYIYDELPALIDAKRGCKEAIAAPRGEAKSTLITQLFILWCLMTGRKHYPVIIMDAFDQAAMMLESVKAELESNARLKQDYPRRAGAGRVWQVGVIVTADNRKVQAVGSGKRLRGLRHGPYRPDLVVLDDIENDENVRSLAQRDKTESWLKKAVMKLGPPDGSMDVIYVGTILHYDSVMNRTLKNPTWNAHQFRAILKWPDRMDLWERWEEKLANEGQDAAATYYRQHKKKMDAGAVVSWPSVRPLELLMTIRADDHAAFDSELQNDPTNDEHAPFRQIHLWVHAVRSWIYYGACDPSLGKKNKARDPSAILIGGYDRATGVLDVIEANIRRRVPDLIIESIIELQRQYNCLIWAIEAVQFQEFLRTELVKRSAIRGIPVPAIGVTPNVDKALRIESLQPHAANGLIRLHRSQTTLYEQLRHYPEADHDDGPDALQMLWSLIANNAGGVPRIGSRRARHQQSFRGYDYAA